jgi:tetratricopeptide (TPR) repeat protein
MGQYTMALRLTRYYAAQDDSLHESDVWQEYRALFPEDPRGYENEIAALDAFQPDDHLRKIRIYEEWMRIDPQNSLPRRGHAIECMNAGLSLYASGDSRGAERYYLLSINSDSTNSHPHTNLGIIYAESGHLQAAIRQFFTAIRIDSVDADAYYNLGIAFQDSGKEKESAAYLNTAARLGNVNAKKALQR